MYLIEIRMISLPPYYCSLQNTLRGNYAKGRVWPSANAENQNITEFALFNMGFRLKNPNPQERTGRNGRW
ncbi:MAG: hypothetical protein DCC43_10830 [Candidatus Brocadia sp.]|nr:hypothetical protein [Candidatus Brocadia sp. AMX3]OQZ02874.1 MAG: hypothetical protein B6D35_00395 [Candidatus Brocadia sp. UTAMX2]RIJ96808.1 MAG: hypothetical protein DCC43_10830 [Candidatus Brocadia sp.]